MYLEAMAVLEKAKLIEKDNELVSVLIDII
jgi:hypothetical protein